MKYLILYFVFLSSNVFGQNLSIKEMESYLGNNKNDVITIIKNKGFKSVTSGEIKNAGDEMATQLTKVTGKKLKAENLSLNSYSLTLIVDEKGLIRAIQIGTKRLKGDEVTNRIQEIEKAGFVKNSDREGSDGRSNIKDYEKKDNICSLAIYFNGGYTNTMYSKNLLN
ncbi:hypothetical protein RCC89_19860 [Cytophagaceae bacterium ABcell3]|nr:hypothetical protein RCC89_19860 [Cytophagaceae bacterium ABcell3]